MKIIDKYSLNARFYPMVLFYLPVLLLGILFSFQFNKITHQLTSLGILSAVFFFIKQIGRDAGKVREKSLWEAWGGAPTTQLLRWRNTTVDINTKKRHHLKLQTLCPVEKMPDQDFENSSPEEADAVYQAWTKYLISKTRDTKKYPLLFTENISYGFRRNLWGLKIYAIVLLIVLMASTYIYYGITTKTYNPISFPGLFIIAEFGLLALILLWIFKVTANWVRIPANVYAERLMEAIESLKTETVKKEKPKGKEKK